jgi:hypothetical protein
MTESPTSSDCCSYSFRNLFLERSSDFCFLLIISKMGGMLVLRLVDSLVLGGLADVLFLDLVDMVSVVKK